MQTTLLGLAVAIIVALVAALVGPLFIDWGRYRSAFEAEATRLVGMPVRVAGGIDARLLPTPSLFLNGIEIGAPGREPKLRARSLGVEFGLGPLMRGEWRASQLHLDGPEVAVGIDSAGRIDVPRAAIGFDPDALSFDRVVIENGRAVLSDAASGGRLVLDQLWFKGDIRSLLGPFRGEGAFVSAGQLYGYRVSGSRRADDGGMRLRLSVDPSDRPLAIETDGTLWVERELPRYEGNLVLARPAGMVLSSGQAVASEPWRTTSRVKATSAAVLFEQIDIQYGPDDRAIKLAGTADLKFGAKPRFEGVLSARQVDLDRALLAADAVKRSPIALLRTMTDTLSDLGRPPLPMKIGLGIDSLSLGGAQLTTVRGDILSDGDAWSLDSFEFRAPGATQVRASGRLKLAAKVAEFSGPANVESTDPKALIAWLEGRPDAARAPIGPLQARGEVTLGGERLAIDRFEAKFDRKMVAGRLAYAFASEQRPARLDAAINAAEFDIDGALAFLNNLAGATFDRPGEIALALDFGRATYAGIEAKGAAANLKFDASGLVIERLSVADFGGALINASGRIDTTSPSPRGSIALTLEAQRLTGVAALAAKFAPAHIADMLQALTQRSSSAKLSAKLDVAPLAASGPKTSATLALAGAIAGIRINMTAEGNGDAARPAAADLRVNGSLEADDGASLAAFVGLDRLATLERRPARLVLNANGPADGDLRVDAKFAGAGLDAAAAGALRFAAAGPTGALDVTFTAADARLPRRDAGAAIPVALTTRLGIDGDRLTLDRLNAKIAGAQVNGRLALLLGHPTRIDGRIEADTADASAVIATAIGTPPTSRKTAWPPDPFVPSALADVEGRIEFAITRAVLGGIVGRQLRGVARFERSAIALENIEGSIGEGRLAAQAKFRATSSGVSSEARVSLANADLSALMPRSALGQVAGRITLELTTQGTGMSPAALVGALSGRGTATIDNLQISGFDPAAIEAASRAAQRGVAIDAVRIGDVLRSGLDAGRLNIPAASAVVTIEAGRATLSPLTVPAAGADVGISGSYDLGADALDLRFGLIGPLKADAPGGQRPEISIALKGPVDTPRRTVEVASLVNWLTMRAVEQEAKRLAAAEQEAKRIQAQEETRRLAEEARRAAEDARRLAEEEARRFADAEAKRAAKAAEEARRAQEAERAAEAAETARRAHEAALPLSTAATPLSGAGAPAFDKLPALPAPIEIRPLPGRTQVKPAEVKPRRTPPPPPHTQRATTMAPVAPPQVITPPDPRQ